MSLLNIGVINAGINMENKINSLKFCYLCRGEDEIECLGTKSKSVQQTENLATTSELVMAGGVDMVSAVPELKTFQQIKVVWTAPTSRKEEKRV